MADSTEQPPASVQARIEEYWEWVAVALFLLLSVDLLTSFYAVAVVGVGAEANPLMAWLLGRSVWLVVTVHLGVVGLAVGFFWALMRLYRSTPTPYRRPFGLLIELWLGLLVAAGLWVFANNVSVVVLGESLL